MLGSRKLLIVLCIVPCILSLVCIGAFAAPAEDVTPSVVLPLDTEVVEDVLRSPSVLAEETFPAEPLLESSYYRYETTYWRLPGNTSPLSVFSFSIYDTNGRYVCGGSSDSANLYRASAGSSLGVMFGGVFYSLDSSSWEGVSPYSVVIFSSSSSLSLGGETVSGTLVEESLVPEVADSIFDLGDALITFIMSSWVVMIPLAAWLVILCIGAIRKLVKGV